MPVLLSSEPVFWFYVKEVLSKHELPRFYSLRHIASDVGRGRAWLRCALNEHSLERYLHMLLADRSRLRYRGWASGGRRSQLVRIAESDCLGLYPSLLIGGTHVPLLQSQCILLCSGHSWSENNYCERMNARKVLCMAPAYNKYSINAYYLVWNVERAVVPGYSLLFVWWNFNLGSFQIQSFFLGRNWVFSAQFCVCLSFVLDSLQFLLFF